MAPDEPAETAPAEATFAPAPVFEGAHVALPTAADAIAAREETKTVEAPADAIAEPSAEEAGPTIDWERWVGIRGAAALGAGILVVALIYFLRYSIEEGWLSIGMRVALGFALSCAGIAVAQLRLSKTHPVLSSWISGASIAGLYASVWAAEYLANAFGPIVAFVFVSALTGGAMFLALRTSSLPIALLGLSGGFAAPLSLTMAGAAPAGLVLYVLVLDAAMVALSIRRGWWSLSFMSLVASALYEAVWMHAGTTVAAWHAGVLVVLAGVFGAVPAFAMGEAEGGDEAPPPLARLTRYAAIVVPLAFGAVLALTGDASAPPAPLVGLTTGVVVMAAIIAHRRQEKALPLVAGLGAVAVLGAATMTGSLASHAALVSATLVGLLVPQVVLARVVTREERDASAEIDPLAIQPVLYLAAASLLAIATSALSDDAALPCFAALAAFGATGLYLAKLTRLGTMASTALVALALALSALAVVGGHSALDAVRLGPTASNVIVAAGIGLAAFAAALAWARRADEAFASELLAGNRHAAFVLLGLLTLSAAELSIVAYAALAILVGATVLVSRGGSARSYQALAIAWPASFAIHAWLDPSSAGMATVIGLGAGLALAAAPLVPSLGLLTSARAPRGQAMTLVALSLAFGTHWVAAGAISAGAAIACVAAASLVFAFVTHRRAPSDAVRESAFFWLGGLALASATATVVVAFDGEHVSWGLAIIGLGLAEMHRRTRRDAIALLSIAHLAVAAGRLLLDPRVLAYHERGALPVLDWVTPAYLVPAACAFGAWKLLGGKSTGDGSLWTKASATLGLVLGFAWVNVAVLDGFSTGSAISFETSAGQARDLTMSIAWATFGVGLLLLGMRMRSGALRKTSLALVLVTAAKVFLYDLAALGNLYRVASLVGLAVSLIGISILYQRFVFRSSQNEGSTNDGAPSDAPRKPVRGGAPRSARRAEAR